MTTTTVLIKFNFPAIGGELGRVDDPHGIVSEAVCAVSHYLEKGETAGDIWQEAFGADGETFSFRAASYEVVDERGQAVIDLREVAE